MEDFEYRRHLMKIFNPKKTISSNVEVQLEPDVESTFLTVIEKYPDQAGPKLRYADWLDEQGRGSDADAMRWLVVNGKHPIHYGDSGENQYSWFKDYWYSHEIWQKKLSLPKELFIHLDPLSSQKDPSIHVCYNSFEECVLDFFDAWRKATAQPSWFWRLFGYKAWVPDYTPVEKIKPPQGGTGLITPGHEFSGLALTCNKCGLSQRLILDRKLSCPPKNGEYDFDRADGYPTIL